MAWCCPPSSCCISHFDSEGTRSGLNRFTTSLKPTTDRDKFTCVYKKYDFLVKQNVLPSLIIKVHIRQFFLHIQHVYLPQGHVISLKSLRLLVVLLYHHSLHENFYEPLAHRQILLAHCINYSATFTSPTKNLVALGSWVFVKTTIIWT